MTYNCSCSAILNDQNENRITEFNSSIVNLIVPSKAFEVEIFATFKLFKASLGFGLFYSKYILVLCAYYMISYEV